MLTLLFRLILNTLPVPWVKVVKVTSSTQMWLHSLRPSNLAFCQIFLIFFSYINPLHPHLSRVIIMLSKNTFFLVLCILVSGLSANFEPNFFEQSCPYTNFIKFLNQQQFPQSKPVLRKRVSAFFRSPSSDHNLTFSYIIKFFSFNSSLY